MFEMEVRIDGQWIKVRPSVPPTCPPYRYESKASAKLMLDRLYPGLPNCDKQVVPAEAQQGIAECQKLDTMTL